ncbi:hypothetical protein [Streptomyces sp. MN13]
MIGAGHDGAGATRMPGFTAGSLPGRRFRCHHPVEETEPTGDLVRRSRQPRELP